MKRLLLITSLFISLLSVGQDKNTPPKLLVGINFSPDYSFRTLKDGDGSASTPFIVNSRNDREIAKLGYTAGANITIAFSPLLAFETGIQFANKGYKTKRWDLVYPDPGMPTKAKASYTYQYIGIPLKAKFSFGKHKTRFVSGVGFMTCFLLIAKTTTTYYFSNGNRQVMSQSNTSDFNKVDVSPVLSLGIDYQLTKKTHLSVEPTFRYGLISTKDAQVIEHLWSAGVNVGVNYTLK